MKMLFAFLFVTTMTLVGCAEKTPVQTIDWYKTHEVERLAMIENCSANPGELAASPNCINAKTAANHIAVDKRGYQKLTPINPLKGGN
ncbi:EexN family lipoprotein [Collimonas antrihumi]|uniref:EexN family lipoprotein n=1 Tax=Collimonas antrihumi TaxID=1940615 RepID=UPI001B8D7342|nr:EexN family lipoprotein [Collimonas antrihumi]